MRNTPTAVAAILLISFALLASTVLAQTYDEAQKALNASEKTIAEMQAQNFSVSMVNDTLQEALQIFTAQELINRSGGGADYSLVITKTNSIEEIRASALNAYDELVALEKTLAELTGADRQAVSQYFEEARAEFYNERYDNVKGKVDAVYQKISEQQALNTKVAAMLDASRKNIVGFFEANWMYLLSAAIVIVVIVSVTANRFLRYRITKKMRTLNMEKVVITELMKDTQRMYFEQAKISDDMYKVRIDKFEELMRDIDRQLPLLREELELRSGIFFFKR
jgi:predicted transcriptional regulator